ncbi:MAG: hypothetical protein WD988_05130 [Candidatus Curtissbacteria bacterium]
MKVIIFPLAVFAIIGIIYGLWQLQPKAVPTQTVISEKSQDPSPAPAESQQALEPQDGSVTTNEVVIFKGKALPGSIVFIVSNDFNATTKANEAGSFAKEVTLSPDLNLIDVISISPDLSKETLKSISVYFSQNSKDTNVAAGTVKTIFDNVITLTTLNGQKNIKTQENTAITFPKDITDAQPAQSAKDIRVGDYAISLGSLENTDTQTAKNITIVRVDKPQNQRVLTTATILTLPKQSLFTAKTIKDSKILELTLDKNTQGLEDGKETTIDNIEKDKKVIIIYHPDAAKKIVDLIYLLP